VISYTKGEYNIHIYKMVSTSEIHVFLHKNGEYISSKPFTLEDPREQIDCDLILRKMFLGAFE
jgi:hypothetical protein